MLKTIRGKITTGIIVISLIILIIINLFIWRIFGSNLQNFILNDMEGVRKTVYDELQSKTLGSHVGMNLYNRHNLWSLMNTTNIQYDMYLSINYSSDGYRQFVGDLIDEESVEKILVDSGQKSSLLYSHNKNGIYYASYSYPIYLKDQYGGIFVFQKDYSNQYNNYKELMTRILLIQIFLFILMIIINFIWLKRSTDSLNTLSKGIRSIGEGEYSNKLEAKSKDEVAILIHHFNRMQDKIVAQMEYLQEEKVKTERLEKSTRDFFNYASHEMKTPITSITGYAQLLDQGKIDEEVKSRAYKRIITESNRMNKMVQNMLTIAKGEKIEEEYLEYLNLNKLVEEMSREYELIFDKAKIRLELENTDLIIFACKEEIGAIISNLLDNAIKYSSDGRINISSFSQDYATIVIENKISPLPLDIRDNLFQPFVKYNHGDEKQASSGLGLYICKELAERNKGRISYTINGDIIRFKIELARASN